MKRWLERLRGALGMGVTWGVAWALFGVLIGVGLTLGLPLGWFVEVFDAPLPALWVPGFLCGTAFAGVLAIAGRRRRFDELSLPWFTGMGAAGGLLLSMVPVVLAGPYSSPGVMAVATGTLTLLSAASAAGTLALARLSEDRDLLSASDDVAGAGLTPGEGRDLLDGG